MANMHWMILQYPLISHNIITICLMSLEASKPPVHHINGPFDVRQLQLQQLLLVIYSQSLRMKGWMKGWMEG